MESAVRTPLFWYRQPFVQPVAAKSVVSLVVCRCLRACAHLDPYAARRPRHDEARRAQFHKSHIGETLKLRVQLPNLPDSPRSWPRRRPYTAASGRTARRSGCMPRRCVRRPTLQGCRTGVPTAVGIPGIRRRPEPSIPRGQCPLPVSSSVSPHRRPDAGGRLGHRRRRRSGAHGSRWPVHRCRSVRPVTSLRQLRGLGAYCFRHWRWSG